MALNKLSPKTNFEKLEKILNTIFIQTKFKLR